MHTNQREAEEVLAAAVSGYVESVFNAAIRNAITKVLPNAAQDWVAPSTPLPGQLWLAQGGTYAGIVRGDDGTLFHLIVGPESMDFDEQPWGGRGKDEEGATSIWDGLANTRALVESKIDHPAAQAIVQINAGNSMGWYLPAQVELSLCRATVRHLFQPAWYWSSTQCSSIYAWSQHFEHGYQFINLKDYTGRARAVRRLVIQ